MTLDEELEMTLNEEFVIWFNHKAWGCHSLAKKNGFWDDSDLNGRPAKSAKEALPIIRRHDNEVISKVALMHSELSEAVEGYRKGRLSPDEHCPEFSNFEIELADCIIRIMDLAGAMNLNVGGAIVAKHKFNATRPYKHGKNL